MYIYKGKKHDNVINANYRITVNSRLLDTPLLRTVAKSPAETTKKCMEITPAIHGLPLLRNCGHFMWSQLNIFIVLLPLQRTLS